MLERSIGVYAEEQLSYDRVTLLMWLLPLVVVTALLLDIFLIAGIIDTSRIASISVTVFVINFNLPILIPVFHWCAHPWLVLVTEDKEEENKKVEEELMSYLIKEFEVIKTCQCLE